MSKPPSSRLSSFRGKSSSSVTSSNSSSVTDLTAQTETLQLEPEVQSDDQDSETGKFRQLLGILKKAIGVSDLSGLRISLPANLLEPIGNLEYWQYAERPDFFAAMGDSEDELERMLSVTRWLFTKDLKFVKHKIAKPYNSILGEHFHCHYDIEPINVTADGPQPVHYLDPNPSPEVLSYAGRLATPASSAKTTPASTPLPTPSLAPVASPSAAPSFVSSSSASATESTSTAATSLSGKASTRVVFLNEQTSHHPPISHFQIESRGPCGTVIATGADQLSAKFTGTNVKVFPGTHNKGIFVNLPERKEEYQITHPTAIVAGLLRGSPYATIGEHTYVTCRGGSGKKLRAIIQYQEESWLLKPKFAIEGVIYEYPTGKEAEWTKIKHVPQDKVLVQLEGCWRGDIRFKKPGDATWSTLVDLVPLAVAPKTVAPLDQQHELETRKVWSSVTNALLVKDWNTASKAKQALEQEQRNKAEERKKKGETYIPVYFEPQGDDWTGRPTPTKAGRDAIEKEFTASYE